MRQLDCRRSSSATWPQGWLLPPLPRHAIRPRSGRRGATKLGSRSFTARHGSVHCVHQRLFLSRVRPPRPHSRARPRTARGATTAPFNRAPSPIRLFGLRGVSARSNMHALSSQWCRREEQRRRISAEINAHLHFGADRSRDHPIRLRESQRRHPLIIRTYTIDRRALAVLASLTYFKWRSSERRTRNDNARNDVRNGAKPNPIALPSTSRFLRRAGRACVVCKRTSSSRLERTHTHAHKAVKTNACPASSLWG